MSGLAKEMNLAKSTVSTVWCKRESYEALSKSAAFGERMLVVKKRDPRMEKMENMLCSWIEDRTQRRQPITQALISNKAMSLWNNLAEEEEEPQPSTSAASPSGAPPATTHPPTTFKASNGWFQRFKARAKLHNVRIQGEAAAADTDAAREFPAKLLKVVEDSKYDPCQVFNIDKTRLNWKRVPSRQVKFESYKKY